MKKGFQNNQKKIISIFKRIYYFFQKKKITSKYILQKTKKLTNKTWL